MADLAESIRVHMRHGGAPITFDEIASPQVRGRKLGRYGGRAGRASTSRTPAIAWATVVAVALAALVVGGVIVSKSRPPFAKPSNSVPSATTLNVCDFKTGTPPMPRATRLTTTIDLGFNGITLSPPPRDIQPRINASEAWSRVHLDQVTVTYQMVLAQWHSSVPLGSNVTNALVWVIEGSNVVTHAFGAKKAPFCGVGPAWWPVNALTGEWYGELSEG